MAHSAHSPWEKLASVARVGNRPMPGKWHWTKETTPARLEEGCSPSPRRSRVLVEPQGRKVRALESSSGLKRAEDSLAVEAHG
eukprot:2875894-Rhodomonas_salina.2